MRIFIDDNTNREFQLPAGFHPELSRTNPFLTDEGSQSIPLTLPASDHNMILIGAHHRGVHTNRPVRRLNVILQHGAVNMRGILAIDSAHRKEGIGCTFYTSEGQLYATIGEKILGDLDWPVKSISGGVAARIAELKKVLDDDPGYDYWIFPVLSDNDIERTGFEGETKFILNEFISTGTNPPSDIYFVGEKVRDWVYKNGTDEVVSTLPVGYGISPFLKVSYVLRFIFNSFGYEMPESIFDTDISLRQLVVVNNTADSIVDAGTLYYRQLIPEKTSIMTFINMLRLKFGIEFIENGNQIQVRSWNQAIDDLPDFDFSSRSNKDISIDFEYPKVITITMNRSLEPYASVEGNSEIELRRKYPNVGLDVSIGRYSISVATRPGRFIQQWVSSSFWDKLNEAEYTKENIEHSDIAVPGAIQAGTIYDYGETHSMRFHLPFIGSIRNVNSEVTIENTDEVMEEDKAELQLMICFSVPGWVYDESSRNRRSKMGSSFKYSMYGGEGWGSVSLIATGESSLYDIFYVRRDAMLQHANQIIKFNSRLLPEEIVNMDLSVPKIVNGIKILIERIDYVLGRADLCQVTARTLHEFKE